MDRLNEILHELGISKVKLAKYLGVSRQMIYNYLELDDINKWPKDKKVLLLNLLGVKSADEINLRDRFVPCCRKKQSLAPETGNRRKRIHARCRRQDKRLRDCSFGLNWLPRRLFSA